VNYSVTSDCDGALSAIITVRQCSIPYATLLAAPFNLPWGSSIYAKVSAVNIMGSSVVSAAGNGATMMRVPDAPVSLRN